MSTRLPRKSNVKFTKQSSYSKYFCALVQVAASRAVPTASPALRLPPKAFTTQAWSSYRGIPIHKTQRHIQYTPKMKAHILSVNPQRLGNVTFDDSTGDWIDSWDIEYNEGSDYHSLQQAAHELINTDTPVAFPTETVYGLGADATRSSAVRSIFAAKGRPADNPLIVHFHSLPQLRALLLAGQGNDASNTKSCSDPIPEIYRPIIERFWPGPITIILPTPEQSVLAPEVTAGLTTFGARMPRSILALGLLRLCGRPLAAPSANASTRPSPTAAEHVYDDLQERINTIIDGGPCEVGVESTVVDGLSSPPSVLRPGGVTIEQLRQCPGWENVVIGYKDKQEGGTAKPRAPGMKYRHYSPKAEVLLFEAGAGKPDQEEIERKRKIGIIRTTSWEASLGLGAQRSLENGNAAGQLINESSDKPTSMSTSTSTSTISPNETSRSNLLRSLIQHQVPHAERFVLENNKGIEIWDIHLGAKIEDVARGIFSALRELDKKGVETIFVEGIDDKSGDDIAAAVMNRLRKAAEVRV